MLVILIIYAAILTNNDRYHFAALYSKFERILTFRIRYKYWTLSTFIYGLLLILFSTVFWLNLEHTVERTIWTSRYVPLADSILSQGQYLHREFEGPATYPIWGYPILAALVKFVSGSAENIVFLQFLLFLWSSLLVCDLVLIRNRILSPAIIFALGFGQFYYAMILSAKWPDAIMAFLLLMSAIHHYKKKYLVAALALALAYNFRSESLIFFLIYATYLVVKKRKFLGILIGILLIVPWGLFNFVHHGKFLVGSSNGGAVLYLTLGQLPGNIWKREHSDEVAVKFAQDHGIHPPWSLEGDALMRKAFMDDVKAHPIAFVRKIYHNGIRALEGGLYTWEGKGELRYRISQSAKIFLPIVCFMALWAIARIGFPFNPIAIMILAQIALITVLQYQPRHMSHVAALFVFLFLPDPKPTVQSKTALNPKLGGTL
jgi:hypothetical protein